MRRRMVVVAVSAALLAGCLAGGRRRYVPAQVRIQSLELKPDGQAELRVWVSNPTREPIALARLELSLSFSAGEVLRMDQQLSALAISANGAEVVTAGVRPSAALSALFESQSEIPYRLTAAVWPVDGDNPSRGIRLDSVFFRVPGERLLFR